MIVAVLAAVAADCFTVNRFSMLARTIRGPGRRLECSLGVPGIDAAVFHSPASVFRSL